MPCSKYKAPSRIHIPISSSILTSPQGILISKILQQGYYGPSGGHREPFPVVSLEDFFTGNTDPYSIACNLDPHPGLDFIYSKLKEIRSRNDVQDVLVEISEIDVEVIKSGEKNKWPCFSEIVYVITSAPAEEVAKWNKNLRADGPVKGWSQPIPPKIFSSVKYGDAIWQIIWD